MSDPHGVDIDPRFGAAFDGLPTDLAGFRRRYESEVLPALMEREHEREAAAKKARQFSLYGVLAGGAGVALSFLVFHVPAIAVVSGFAGFGLAMWGRMPLKKIEKQAKAMLVEPIANELGLLYTADCGTQSLVHTFKQHRLLPSWDRSKFEDRMEGRRNDVDFEFFEAHLEQRRQSRSSNGSTRTYYVTVFRGQCIRFNFHKRFYGRTLVTRDAGIFNALGGIGSDLDRARLEDPVFEKAFEVYTNDQVEARFLLTPDVMQRIVDLEQAFHGAKLRCAFVDEQLYLALEGGDLFEPGSMFKRLDDPERVRELLQDFASLFKLIDALGPRAGTDRSKMSDI